MKIKMNYTSYTLLEEKLPSSVKGYDAEEVDRFLDEVIRDYAAYQTDYTEAHEYIKVLEARIRKNRERIAKLKADNEKLEEILKSIDKDSSEASRDNAVYVQRISELERMMYDNNLDPKTGKPL